jgi:hypothetical protein
LPITYADAYLHAYPHTDAYSYPKSDSNTTITPRFDRAADSAAPPYTAAYRFTERDAGTAAYSATTPYTAADAYRLAAPYPSTPPVAFIRFAQAETAR